VTDRGQSPSRHDVRLAGPDDAAAVARMLFDFNAEFDVPSPPPETLAERLRVLLAEDTRVLLSGDGPDGLALLRLRRSLWTPGLECYLAELYVVPDRRGQGMGRALMEAAMDLARREGADYMDLNTGEDDDAARALYESLGFNRTAGVPGGPIQFYYERDL
jgi:ribosomal protein S18 acetylase RimI-like enzyme